MRNKKKLCLLLTVMMLGLSAVAEEAVIPVEESAQAQVEDKEIKANKETFEKAQEAMANKDFQSAIVYLSVYISSKPKKYEAYKLRGECFYELRQYKLAQKDFETAIKLKTDDDKFVTGAKVLSAVVLGADKQEQYQNPELGNLYAMLMYAQKAQNDVAYEASLENAGKYNSHIYLPKPEKNDIAKINCPQKYGKKINQAGVNKYIYDAIEDISKQDFNEAVYKTQYITSNYPKYFLGYYLSGVALVGLEQEKEAVSAFETAINLNPYDFESYASLGQIYYTEAEMSFLDEYAKKSVGYFKKALEYNPNCYLYHYYIGLNYMQLNDYESAISSFNSAIKHKQNDYNSRYYRSIAQFMRGDYKEVIDETTKLLYRHVSNYNSVLYLRALANYHIGLTNAALTDIEKIQNNMNDIYNDDVKMVSAKEKTLPEYLYYVKAKITKDSGFGAVSDFNNAFKNSIIKGLSNASPTVKSVLTVSQKDIDNQYDYIRTTFNNLDLAIGITDSEYAITVNNVNEVSQKTVGAEQELILPVGNQTSIAQMLASNSLGSIKEEALVPETEKSSDVSDSESLESELGGVNSIEQSSDLTVESDAEEIIAQTSKKDGVKIIAEEVKQTKDFTISYTKDSEPIKEIEEKVQTKTEESVSKIVEKHADVDLSEFNVSKPSTPEIVPTDEVIEFKPEEKFVFRAENIVEQPSFNITVPKTEPIEAIEEQVTAMAEETVMAEEAVTESENIKNTQVEIQEPIVQVVEEQRVEIKTVDTADEDAIVAEKSGVVETTSANPLLHRIMLPTMIEPEKKTEVLKEEPSVVVSSQWVEPDSEPQSIVVIDKKIEGVEEASVPETVLAEAKNVIEKALESAETIDSIDVSQNVNIKPKKSRKHKIKVKKDDLKEKTETEVAVEAIVQSVFTGETEDVVKSVVNELNVEETKVDDVFLENKAEVNEDLKDVVQEPSVKEVREKKQRIKKERVKKEKAEKPIKVKKECEEKILGVTECEIDITPAITVINPEKTHRESKIRAFKQKLFKKQAKKEKVEVSQVQKEDVQIKATTVEYEVPKKTKFAWKNLFKRKKTSVKDVPVNHEKKVIKEIKK